MFPLVVGRDRRDRPRHRDPMKLTRTLPTLLAVAALVAGCGGGDEEESSSSSEPAEVQAGAETNETFSEEGFDITFEYPEDFEDIAGLTFESEAGAEAGATTAVGLDGTNLIAVQRFDLTTEITDQNFDQVKPGIDQLFSQVAGEQVSGQETEVAGLPALEYEVTIDQAEDIQTRAVAIFDSDTEYLLNCQAGAEQRELILAACDLALETYEPQ
jgi:iron only hydrogenase large subunit-like protein